MSKVKGITKRRANARQQTSTGPIPARPSSKYVTPCKDAAKLFSLVSTAQNNQKNCSKKEPAQNVEGLTVQPCGEPCRSAVGFQFLSLTIISIKNVLVCESMPVDSTMFDMWGV